MTPALKDEQAGPLALGIPHYLRQVYWWAYVHPRAVRLFERDWLVNLILFGNYARLRDAALAELGATVRGRTLQVACVYGDLTVKLHRRLEADARLDVVDILPIQLKNLGRKLPPDAGLTGTRRLLVARLSGCQLRPGAAVLPAARAAAARALLDARRGGAGGPGAVRSSSWIIIGRPLASAAAADAGRVPPAGALRDGSVDAPDQRVYAGCAAAGVLVETDLLRRAVPEAGLLVR